RSLTPDGNLDPALAALGSNIEAASANQRVPGEKRQVQQKLDRLFGKLVIRYHPPELDPSLGPEQPFECHLGFTRIDLFPKSAPCAKGKPEELQLVGRGSSAFRKQLKAFLPHFGIGLVGK